MISFRGRCVWFVCLAACAPCDSDQGGPDGSRVQDVGYRDVADTSVTFRDANPDSSQDTTSDSSVDVRTDDSGVVHPAFPLSCGVTCIPGREILCGACGIATCDSAGRWSACSESDCATAPSQVDAFPSDWVRLGGRWEYLAKPRCNFSGCSFRVAFDGTALWATIADGNGGTANGNPATFPDFDNEITCWVDGARTGRVSLESNATREVQLANGLVMGPHWIECRKGSEPFRGMVQLKSMRTDGSFRPVPDWPYHVLFIGDSITAGSGNTGTALTPGGVCDAQDQVYQDGMRAFAGHVAGAFDAELIVGAQSGSAATHVEHRKELLEHRLGATALFGLDPTVPANDSPADAIVINLGTNDPGDTPEYRSAMSELIDKARTLHPTAHIVLMFGPMTPASSFATAKTELLTTHTNISALDVPFDTSMRIGCTRHPNLAHHAELGMRIRSHLVAELGWCEVE